MAREFSENFVIGGLLVMLAIWVAKVSTPVMGGIIAAVPIRYAVTWSIAAVRRGKEFAEDMARGSVIGMPGNITFSLALFAMLLVSIDFLTAFIVSILAGIAVLALCKFTFPG